jgi:hypothetical protein
LKFDDSQSKIYIYDKFRKNFTKSTMKVIEAIILSFILICWSQSAKAQLFYFEDTETTLTKTVDQSPAHWYIEIFTNSSIDTTLTWEARFLNIPNEWVINLDCQNPNGVWYPIVEDGDSEDFTLIANGDFPQKLIIGAMFNEVTGTGTVFFDIFDKEDPDYKIEIAYHFITTAGNLGLQEFANEKFELRKNKLHIRTNETSEVSVFDLEGNKILDQVGEKEIDLSDFAMRLVILQIRIGNDYYSLKTIPK